MNTIYETPNAEVINFTAMEQIAVSNPQVGLGDLSGDIGVAGRPSTGDL